MTVASSRSRGTVPHDPDRGPAGEVFRHVCAWCGDVIPVAGGPSVILATPQDALQSHGICPDCAVEVLRGAEVLL